MQLPGRASPHPRCRACEGSRANPPAPFDQARTHAPPASAGEELPDPPLPPGQLSARGLFRAHPGDGPGQPRAREASLGSRPWLRGFLVLILGALLAGAGQARPLGPRVLEAPGPAAPPSPQASPAAPASPGAPAAPPSPQASPEASPQTGASPAPGATPPEGLPGPLRVEGAGPSGRPRLAGSLSLEQALQVALAGNLRLAMARTELDASRAEVLAVAARKGPQLSLGAVLATGDFDMIYPGAPGVMPQFLARLPGDQVLDVNAMVMVPLFTGGQLSAALEAARQAEKAAVARVAFSQRETARKVRAAYWMVLLAGQELEVARWRLAEQQEMLRLAREQLEAGRVARFVVLRAEAEEAMARQELNSARAALVEAEGELKMAMGVDVTSSLACSDPFAAPPAPGPEEQDMKTALRERPDLVAARHGVEEGARRVDEARAAYSPRLYATGMYEGTKIRPFGAGEFMDGFHAGLVLGWQVYDSGERAGMVQAAEAEKRRREIEVQELELEVTRQVQVARARLTAALENLELSRAEVAQAEEDLRIARLRFQVGRGIHLEILDAVATLARARLNAARAGYAANLAWADLLFATGRY